MAYLPFNLAAGTSGGTAAPVTPRRAAPMSYGDWWMQNRGSFDVPLGHIGQSPNPGALYQNYLKTFPAGNAPGTSAGAGTTTGNVGAPTLPDYGEIGGIIDAINASNLAATKRAEDARIPGGPGLEGLSSDRIAELLNPPHEFGEIDVPAAAAGVASGTVGSPFAGISGINLSENERIRRIGLGEDYLSKALARNPAAPIADPQALITALAHERFVADQAARDRAARASESERDRALQAYLGQIHYGGARGGGYGPGLPTDYGGGEPRATAPTSSPRRSLSTARGRCGSTW